MSRFHDVRFEIKQVQPVGGPVFNTIISVTTGGREQAQINWEYPRGRWSFSIPMGRSDLVSYLVSFFRARFGRAYSFRFKDFADYSMARQEIERTDGVTTSFQIIKTYVSGAYSAERKITKPVAGTVRCWVDGVERTLGAGASGFQVDTATGIITLGSTLVALNDKAIEVSCEFDAHVRFETDELMLETPRDGYASMSEVAVVEIQE